MKTKNIILRLSIILTAILSLNYEIRMASVEDIPDLQPFVTSYYLYLVFAVISTFLSIILGKATHIGITVVRTLFLAIGTIMIASASNTVGIYSKIIDGDHVSLTQAYVELNTNAEKVSAALGASLLSAAIFFILTITSIVSIILLAIKKPNHSQNAPTSDDRT